MYTNLKQQYIVPLDNNANNINIFSVKCFFPWALIHLF